MFDLRYHVASLAAVFIALAVGIVIGVAIASGGAVDKAVLSERDRQIRDLQAELTATQRSVDNVEARGRAVSELLNDAYPTLMEGLLYGKQIGIIYLGNTDSSIERAVEKTLTDAGSERAVRLTALELPVDPTALDDLIAGDPSLAAFGSQGGLEGLGVGLGREFVAGGVPTIWEAVDEQLVEVREGSPTLPIDAVVVVRPWASPAEDASPDEQEADTATNELLNGILEGLKDTSVPVVGVERSETDPSTVDFFRSNGLSSVDDVDALPGRLALALLLAGADPGQYGISDSAGAVVPPFDSVPAPVTTVAE